MLLGAGGNAAQAADLPGGDRTRWGMTSLEIARLYRGRAATLSGRIDFNQLYSEVALRKAPLAGHDFTVYFQMSDDTGRLSHVLLERRRAIGHAGAVARRARRAEGLVRRDRAQLLEMVPRRLGLAGASPGWAQRQTAKFQFREAAHDALTRI